MKTAIIILNYNDYENTKKYVESIKNYQILNKIVIVDNASSRKNEIKNLKKLENDKIHLVLSDKNGGYAYGNNVGLKWLEKQSKEEKFDYVIISNPDVEVEENTIIKCLEYLQQHEKTAIVAPRMHFINGPARRSSWKKRTFMIDVASSTRLTELLFYPFLKKGEFTKEELQKEQLRVFAVAGSFYVANFDRLKEVDFLDENTFLFFEEDILGEKIEQKGYDIVALNHLKFMHYDSQCIGKLMNMFKKQKILFASRIYYHKQYHHINMLQIGIFYLLQYIRMLELCLEVPIRKLLNR